MYHLVDKISHFVNVEICVLFYSDDSSLIVVYSTEGNQCILRFSSRISGSCSSNSGTFLLGNFDIEVWTNVILFSVMTDHQIVTYECPLGFFSKRIIFIVKVKVEALGAVHHTEEVRPVFFIDLNGLTVEHFSNSHLKVVVIDE